MITQNLIRDAKTYKKNFQNQSVKELRCRYFETCISVIGSIHRDEIAQNRLFFLVKKSCISLLYSLPPKISSLLSCNTGLNTAPELLADGPHNGCRQVPPSFIACRFHICYVALRNSWDLSFHLCPDVAVEWVHVAGIEGPLLLWQKPTGAQFLLQILPQISVSSPFPKQCPSYETDSEDKADSSQ